LVFSFNKKDSKSSFEAAHVDSRAHALRLHQVLKEKSSSWIKFGPNQDGEEDFQEKTCVMFVSLRFLF